MLKVGSVVYLAGFDGLSGTGVVARIRPDEYWVAVEFKDSTNLIYQKIPLNPKLNTYQGRKILHRADGDCEKGWLVPLDKLILQCNSLIESYAKINKFEAVLNVY